MALAIVFDYLFKTILTAYFWIFAIAGVTLYMIGFIGLKKNYALQRQIVLKQKELLEEEIAIKRLEKERLMKDANKK